MYATHQLAKYSSDPCKPHGEAALYLVQYLKKSCDIGIRFQPNPKKGFECYCDADFSRAWNKQFAQHNPSTAKSRSGWVIFYAGCPIIWSSKLQTQVALLTTKACSLNHQSRIHSHVSSLTLRPSNHVPYTRNKGEEVSSYLHKIIHLLQGL
jgi:hypothetical protein